MSWKLRAAISALLLAPQAAFSLGLGDIRLSSALNEPLSAEIDLVAPTNEELGSLSAQLASRELFQRYGLDRPAYLDSMRFSVGKARDGRSVLLVNSAAPISEPFVTFLVEVSWPRGRLLREYTVLLDPPVFAPKEAAPAAAVAAPRTAAPARSAAAPASAPPAPVAQPARPAAAAGELPSSYRVQRGDTLYGVASRYTGGVPAETNRMMIAMFRANPEAFGGNINILRSGAILRVPGPDAVSQISSGEAASEIGRQAAAWRGGAAAEPVLRLVPPTEAAPGPSTAGEAAGDLQSQIAELNRQIEESRRLLELNSAKLARLQQQAAEAAAAAAAKPPAEAPAEAPVTEAPVAAAPAAPAPEQPAVATTPPAEPAPAPEAPPAKPKATTPPPAAEPGFFDKLTGNWEYLLGAAVLLLGGGLAFGYMRRRREEDYGDATQSFDLPETAPVPSETARLRALSEEAMLGTTTEEQELEDFRTSTIPPSGKTASDFGAAVEPEPAAQPPLDLDQGDPLAEADFHMAYGLYDQAADIVKLALEKEPTRLDYKMKLLEIYFVANDKDNFLPAARDYAESRGDADAGDWERVLIMGRQLAPDDALFKTAARSSGVDLNLEGGDSRVDLELLAPPEGDDSIDLDLGEALGAADSKADTGEAETLEFDMERGGGGDSPTAELPRLSEDTGELPRLDVTAEMPPLAEVTAEMPTLEIRTGQTQTVESTRLQPSALDVTAEMPMDDLNIDMTELEALAGSRPEDDVTRVAAEDDDATRQMAADEDSMDFDISDLAPEEGEDTQRIKLDLGRRMPAEPEPESDYSQTEEVPIEQLPSMSELEPVTMSEVGTKLDLARAYLDMGDPDGARSILDEVMKEGSASQKQEAQRLLDSLPGA